MNKKSILTVISLSVISTFLIIGVAYAVSYLAVSLSPDTPAGGYLPATSTNVAFVKFDFTNTASSTEDIILDKLAVTNYGTSSTTFRVFSMLYLYDDTATSTLIATTTKRIGENTFVFNDFAFTIPSSTVKSLLIKGDLGSSATSSQTIRLGIDNESAVRAHGAITGATTTISGNFPILGNTFTIY